MTQPTPGSTPKHPVWVADVPYTPTAADRLVDVLNVTAKIITVAYTLMCAWEVAKALNPPLKVKQDIAIAALKQKFAKAVDTLPELTNDDRAELYDFLRG